VGKDAGKAGGAGAGRLVQRLAQAGARLERAPGPVVAAAFLAVPVLAFAAGRAWPGIAALVAAALALLALAVAVARFFAAAELRRAAGFLEHHFGPLLRLDRAGEIVYANRAAAALARELACASLRELLPPDLPDRLTRLRADPARRDRWQYAREARALEAEVHFLPDAGAFYVSLRDVTERRLTEERLVYRAYHDPLTGLPNRHMLAEVAQQALGAAGQGGLRAAVLLIGADRLRRVTDTMGNATAAQLAQAFAARLKTLLDGCREQCRNTSLYQFGDDVYAVFAPGIDGPTAAEVAQRLVAGAGEPLYVAGREFFLDVSIGVALFPEDGGNAAELIKNAASALARARAQGGRGFRLYQSEMNAMASHWLRLENYLRHAIERDELKLYYQPQVDLRTGRIVALEALLRWHHPHQGTLLPEAFIRLAEDSGMIYAIGEWVLRAACAQNRDWRSRGVLEATVAVNISARQFHSENLPALVQRTLADTGLPPEALELEITESVAMEDAPRTAEMLQQLRGMGVRLAIDDFGIGFSSLAYLRRFPIGRLKIDRSFVRHVATDATDAAIVRAVVTLGHALGLRVGAEGVETPEQARRLRQAECDEAQGLYYSRALPPEALEAYLRTRRAAAGTVEA
jgi:diguanylate cyclase (GGDEF)-like protein